MMQRIVNKLGLFFLVFIPVLLLAQIVDFLQQWHQEQLIEDKVQQISGKPVVFAGDSHIGFGITEDFPGVINVAARSEPYIFTLKKIELLQPKVAIIGLNVLNIQQSNDNTFEEGLLNVAQYRYLFNYLTEEEKQDIFALTDFETEAFFYTKSYFPFLGSRLKQEPDSLIFGGWENWQSVSTINPFLMEKRYENEFERYNFQLSGLQIKYLEKILKYAAQKNIQVVFLSMPLHPDFIKLIPRQPFADFQQVLKSLQSTKAFIYFDYTHFPLPSNYFYDSDHLNGLGADTITRILLERLKKEGIVLN